MRSNQSSASNSTTENKKHTIIQKTNLPSKPIHALEQLRIWAQFENAEESFTRIFLVSELLWLIWAFGISTQYKRKQKLVPIIITNLKNRIPFVEEALGKNNIFME